MSKMEQLRNKAFGFFEGRNMRNNLVSLIEKHVADKPDGIAFRWPDPSKPVLWDEAVETQISHRQIPYTETDIDLPAFPIFSLNNPAAGN